MRDWEALLRSEEPFAVGGVEGAIPWRRLLSIIVVFGGFYGLVMGLYGLRPEQALYSAIKIPLLLVCTTAVCLPSYFVGTTVMGLREDFGPAVRGILAAQAVLAVTLASLSPVVMLFYVSTDDYPTTKLMHAGLFALAALAAQRMLVRHYRPLVARRPLNRWAIRIWPLLYIFVAAQLGYALRPYIGKPTLDTTFFREDWFANVYVDFMRTVRQATGG